MAIDKKGGIFNDQGWQHEKRWRLGDVSLLDDPYYSSTSFIPVKQGDIIRCKNLSVVANENERGQSGAIIVNQKFEKQGSATYSQLLGLNSAGEFTGNYPTWWFPFPYEDYEGEPYPLTENEMLLKIGGGSGQYYIAFTMPKNNLKNNPIITVNEEITYSAIGTLAENINVNASSIIGDTNSLVASTQIIQDLIARVAALENNQ